LFLFCFELGQARYAGANGGAPFGTFVHKFCFILKKL